MAQRLLFVAGAVGLLFWAALLGAAPACSQVHDAEELKREATTLFHAGKYADAMPLAERYVAATKARSGPHSLEYAIALHDLALLLQADNQFAEAEAAVRRALAIGESVLPPDDPKIAIGLSTLAKLLEKTNRLPEAEPLMRRALAIDEKRFAPDQPAIANDLGNLAKLLGATNRAAEAEPLLRRALAIREKSLGPDHVYVGTDLLGLAQHLKTLSQLAEAEPLIRRALKIYEANQDSEHANVATALNELAGLLQTTNRLAEAERLLRRALALDEARHGANHPNVATALNNLAEVLKATNRSAEAEPLMRRALEIDEARFGPDHPKVAIILSNLAVLLEEGYARYDESEELKRRALKIDETSLGANHPSVARDLNNLAQLFQHTNRLAEAEPLMRRVLQINETTFGLDHPEVALALNNLATLLEDTDRFAEAEPLMRRALQINETSFGPDHTKVASALGNLANLLQDTNRLAEAEPLRRRALKIEEASFGPDHPEVAVDLNNLALLLQNTNRLAEAEPLMRRALKIDEASFGPDHTNVARDLDGLAALLQDTNRLAEAEPLRRRALKIDEARFGPDHPNVARHLNNLVLLLQNTNRLAEAEPLMRRALKIEEASFGPDHRNVARHLNNLALLLQSTNRLAEAEPLIRRALKIDEASFGPDHPNVAIQLNGLAWFVAERKDWVGALVLARRSTAIRIANARHLRSNSGEGEKRLLSQNIGEFKSHVLMAFRAGANDATMRDEAFALAQRALANDAASALAKSSVRFGAGNDALGALVREQQDLALRREAADSQLLAAFGNVDKAAAAALHAEEARLDARLDVLANRLVTEFPEYAELANPEPLTIAQTQALLEPDESLVQFLDLPQVGRTPETSFAWAITRTSAKWVEIPLGAWALFERVVALRCGLDATAWRDGGALCQKLLGVNYPDPANPLPFDLARAHELYHALFGQFADLIRGKRLLIAPSGALTALPFQVLVTEKPALAIPANWGGYRGVKWLGRQHAITVLPSVASLKALRMRNKLGAAREPFIGFGDPALVGAPNCPKTTVPKYCPGEAVAAARPASSLGAAIVAALGEYFRGGLADVDAVRKLCPLPDTAHELKCVAKSLGAPPERVTTGKAATETAVKAAPLKRYRIVHFATHGLLSAETSKFGKGLAEPALVLTPPTVASDADDGLLTASEITQLKLDADWVVLSACNTAGGQKAGAEALSGLARAFFYAGARTLLVSHWEVDSNAATMLTSGAFKELRAAPAIGPAQALRLSMLALMSDKQHPWNAHPAFWAPFALVGGGW